MSMQVNTLYSITLEWDGGNNVWVIGLDGGIFTFSDPNFALVGGNGSLLSRGSIQMLMIIRRWRVFA